MPTVLETTLPPMPARISKLPTDPRGFPVPWFVEWIEGKPDFRIMDGRKFDRAVTERRCWICGERLGRYLAFLIGPMCLLNRISSEPPSHRDCAEFAARACPFLSRPKMRRNEKGLPEIRPEKGAMILRNPGVALIYVTTAYKLVRDKTDSLFFEFGEPSELLWFAEGREARHEEIMASIESGLPLLREVAEKDGPEAVVYLDRQYGEAMKLITP